MIRTGSFTAYDSGGRAYAIGVFQESEDTVTSAGGHTSTQEKRLVTADGMHVNWRGRGLYEIVAPDRNITVTSQEPDAP